MTVHCPLDGCDYSAEKPGSVVAHISGNSGANDPHDGIGYQQAKSMVGYQKDDSGGAESPDPEDDPEPSKPSRDDAGDSPGGGDTESNPAFGGPDPDPRSDSGGDSTGEPCPHCGEPVENIKDLDPGLYSCSACGGKVRVKP